MEGFINIISQIEQNSERPFGGYKYETAFSVWTKSSSIIPGHRWNFWGVEKVVTSFNDVIKPVFSEKNLINP